MNHVRSWTSAPLAHPRATNVALLRAAAVGGCCAAVLAGLWIGSFAAPPQQHPDAALTLLLRGMAAIKALLLAAGLAALLWRFGRPLSPRAAGGYLAALWTAAGAVTLIAQPAFVAAAAVAFHAAEAVFVVTAWTDGRRHGWWRRPRASGPRYSP